MPTLSIAIDGRQALTAARALERAFGGVGASARRAEGGVQRFTRSINSQLRGLGSFRTGLTGIVSSFAAIGAARGAISTLGTFEQTLARVQGVLGATSGSAEELTSTIARVEEVTRELGATTPFTANEVARAFLNLSRAGLDAEESVAALRPTLDLALVAETDLARASDITASTLRQFGLAATDTERVVDVLTNTANSSNTTLLQLAEGFQLAAPNAAAAGLSLERTAAILGILADAGQKATVGGTQLRGIITALVGPSRAAEAALARLNVVQRENGDGSLRLVEILKTLGDANLSLGDAVAIFNRRQASGGLITSAAVDTINELTRANEDAAGVARENADLVGNTLPASFAALRSAVDEVVLSTGDNGLTATIRSVTDGLTLAVRAFGTTRDGVTTTTVVVRGLVAGLGAAGLLGALVSLGAFIGPAGIIVAGLSAAVGIFGSWATSTSAATVQQRELNAELRKLNVELDASEDAFTRARRAGDLFGQSQALQGRAQGLRRQASAIRDSGADRVRLLDRDSDPASGLQLTPRIRAAFSLALQEAIGDLGQQRVAAQNRLEGAGNRRQEFTAQSEVRQLTDRIDRLNTLQQQGTLSSRDLAFVEDDLARVSVGAEQLAKVFENSADRVLESAQELGERARSQEPAGPPIPAGGLGRSQASASSPFEGLSDPRDLFPELVEAEKDLADARRQGRAAMRDLLSTLQEDVSLSRLSQAQAERESAALEVLRIAREANLNLTEQEIQQRQGQARESVRQRQLNQDLTFQSRSLAESTVDGFIAGIAQEDGSLREAGANIVRNLSQGFLEIGVEPLVNALQGGFRTLLSSSGLTSAALESSIQEPAEAGAQQAAATAFSTTVGTAGTAFGTTVGAAGTGVQAALTAAGSSFAAVVQGAATAFAATVNASSSASAASGIVGALGAAGSAAGAAGAGGAGTGGASAATGGSVLLRRPAALVRNGQVLARVADRGPERIDVTPQGGRPPGSGVTDNRTINIMVQEGADFRRTVRQIEQTQGRSIRRASEE